MKPSTAAAVTGMMEAVVNEGTGEPARIPGVQVAGKTGHSGNRSSAPATNNVWFIAFAPGRRPARRRRRDAQESARLRRHDTPRRSPAE